MKMLSLFDSTDEVFPLLSANQKIYVLELDFVRSGIISGDRKPWLCKRTDGGADYYGYDVDFDDGGRGVLWDSQLGATVFTDEQEALKKAAETDFDKVYPSKESMNITECLSVKYSKISGVGRSCATIAKLGEKSMYEKNIYCYAFIRSYASKAKRDKAYEKLVDKIQDLVRHNNAEEINPPEFESPLYKVGDVYASRGYACNHLKKADEEVENETYS